MPSPEDECIHLLSRAACAVCTPRVPQTVAEWYEEISGWQESEGERWGTPIEAQYHGLCAADRRHVIEPGDLIARMPGGAGYACEDCTPGKA